MNAKHVITISLFALFAIGCEPIEHRGTLAPYEPMPVMADPLLSPVQIELINRELRNMDNETICEFDIWGRRLGYYEADAARVFGDHWIVRGWCDDALEFTKKNCRVEADNE